MYYWSFAFFHWRNVYSNQLPTFLVRLFVLYSLSCNCLLFILDTVLYLTCDLQACSYILWFVFSFSLYWSLKHKGVEAMFPFLRGYFVYFITHFILDTVCNCQGFHDNIRQPRWLKQQKTVVSQFWMLKVQNQDGWGSVLSDRCEERSIPYIVHSFWCVAGNI